MNLPKKYSHPKGELNQALYSIPTELQNGTYSVEAFNGTSKVGWDNDASSTPFGQMAFFIEFLKLGNLFDPWVEDCPLALTSPNASSKRDILGTALLSVLAGHTRYAHTNIIRNDGVNPELLGMSGTVSEDALRRNLKKIDAEKGEQWLHKHISKCYAPLLEVPWILDMDTTVKPLYGHQEGAVVGYNPHKPGRPSHTYHTYVIANLRLVLDVVVEAGNHGAASYSASGLWNIIDSLSLSSRPEFIRGDCGFGTDGIMSEAEARNQHYLFKLKQSKNVKFLIEREMKSKHWQIAGQGWEGVESSIQLSGWTKQRRVIILRRAIKTELAVLSTNAEDKQIELNFGSINKQTVVYEYAVLITNLEDEIYTIAQHYRDRADCENLFDEMKNQWGWCGFTTDDLHRCQIMARIIGLIYNWWSIFVRLAKPDKHLEAISSRPLLLYGVAHRTKHAGQNKIQISCQHGKVADIKLFLGRISNFFCELKSIAEQLTTEQRWYRILSKAVEKYLNGEPLKPPICLT